MSAEAIPVRRVGRDGEVALLGEWRPSTRELAIEEHGFPLTPPGIHKVEGDLPWVFDELAPEGFLARRFARWFPEVNLPLDRNLWTSADVVKAISLRGHDLAGNLIVGDASLTRFRQIFRAGTDTGPSRKEAPLHYPGFVDQILTTPAQSSVGGARPKFALRLADRSGLIVKFTPPFSDAFGRRWNDLLRVEALAAETMRESGIDAVVSEHVEHEDRGYLEIERFDRLSGGGRVGHVTLFHLGVALYGEASDPEPVIEGLVRDGHLSGEDADRFRLVHAFSKAIANDDTHLGNYGLLIDDDGKARLSPAYDVLPMAFAPKHDELPDRLVKHTGPRDAQTDELVQRLIAAVEADKDISAAFREAWLRVVR